MDDPSPHKPFDEEARQHGFDPDWLLAYAREHLASPPELINQPVDHDSVIKPLLDKLNQHPISAIWVANFKSFGAKPQRFPLAPVTLVFGPNSAGKSSLLQSLLYAGHVQATGELSVKHPKSCGTVVDLGGFANIQHRRECENSVILGFELAHHFRKRGDDAKPAIWWVTIGFFGRDPKPTIERAALEIDGHELIRYGRVREGEWIRDGRYTNFSHPKIWTRVHDFLTEHFPWDALPDSPEDQNWPSDFSEFVQPIQGLFDASGVEGLFDGVVPAPLAFPKSNEFIDEWEASRLRDGQTTDPSARNWVSVHGPTVRPLYRALVADIREELQTSLNVLREHLPHFLKAIGYLSSTRVQPGRDFENITRRDVNFDVNGGASWEWLAGENSETRERLNKWFAELHARETRGLAKYQFGVSYDLNRNLAEEVIETETHNYLMEKHQEHEEARAQSREDDSAMEVYAFPFDKLDASEITARIMKAIEAKRRATTHRRLTIQDGRSSTEVTAADIGVGIQFLIPVLVEMLSGGSPLKIIEEPELHAHPALQAELGDALIEGALGDKRTTHSSRFLIETHSEHLILRILRRIREAGEGSNKYPVNLPKVRPEDVAVIYVEPSSEGTILHHLKISADGDFIDRWPTGFFTERADELF